MEVNTVLATVPTINNRKERKKRMSNKKNPEQPVTEKFNKVVAMKNPEKIMSVVEGEYGKYFKARLRFTTSAYGL